MQPVDVVILELERFPRPNIYKEEQDLFKKQTKKSEATISYTSFFKHWNQVGQYFPRAYPDRLDEVGATRDIRSYHGYKAASSFVQGLEETLEVTKNKPVFRTHVLNVPFYYTHRGTEHFQKSRDSLFIFDETKKLTDQEILTHPSVKLVDSFLGELDNPQIIIAPFQEGTPEKNMKSFESLLNRVSTMKGRNIMVSRAGGNRSLLFKNIRRKSVGYINSELEKYQTLINLLSPFLPNLYAN